MSACLTLKPAHRQLGTSVSILLNFQSASLVLVCSLTSMLVVMLIITSSIRVEAFNIVMQIKYIMIHQAL